MKQCDFYQGMFVCGNRRPLPKCDFCHARAGENQCDYPIGGKCPKCKGMGVRKPEEREKHFEESFKHTIEHGTDAHLVKVAKEGLAAFEASLRCHPCAGTGKAQCNRYFCGRTCGVRVSADEGYCPDHMERAGKTRPPVKERCWWLEEAKFAGTCLRASCYTEIAVGERCLYFPDRKRVMDEECGEEYLRIAVEQ
jgi:hypothetical protein